MLLAASPPCSTWPRRLRTAYKRIYLLPSRYSLLSGTFLLVLAGLTAGSGLVRTFRAMELVLMVLLTLATITDLIWKRIFNFVPLGLLFSVVVYSISDSSWAGTPGWRTSATGFLVCGVLMLALHAVFGGGEGDVKIVAALGAALGPWPAIDAMMCGFVLAAVVMLFCLFASSVFKLQRVRKLPMAPFFTAGTVVALWR